VSDQDQLGFLLLDQLGDGVGTRLDLVLFPEWRQILAIGLGLGGNLQTVDFSHTGLWAVLFDQLEQLHGCGENQIFIEIDFHGILIELLTGLFVQSLRELVDWWWNLQTLLQNGLVALDAHIFGPTHETGQVTFGLDVLADAVVFRAFLEQWVHHFLHLHFLDGQWGGRHFLARCPFLDLLEILCFLLAFVNITSKCLVVLSPELARNQHFSSGTHLFSNHC
jgi:hypothetical protein